MSKLSSNIKIELRDRPHGSQHSDTARHFTDWCKREGVGPHDEVFEPALRKAIENVIRATAAASTNSREQA